MNYLIRLVTAITSFSKSVEIEKMYFNKERWKKFKQNLGLSCYIVCEPQLFSNFFYLTHSEEDIVKEERKAIQSLIELIEIMSVSKT